MILFLLILFLLIGVAGLIYNVDTGVFVGLGLVPWQLIRLDYSRKLSLLAIGVTVVLGVIFFYRLQNWTLLILFLVIEMYNLWGYYKKYSL
ncbi:MAG: hypothetical protein ACOCQH_00365 [Halanaerobiales bacterium]